MIRMMIIAVALVAGMGVRPVWGQLAITEVMSRASLEIETDTDRPDYWELTNFGTNDIALDGYSFSDDRGEPGLVTAPFADLTIHGGESIVFFRVKPGTRSTITNLARFQEWWGPQYLLEGLQLRIWADPGLNGETLGDELWLYDPGWNVVDHVKLPEIPLPKVGRSLISDPETGASGVFSGPGVNQAFQAVIGGDWGSPGYGGDSVPLRALLEPADQTADAGADVTFTVHAVGLPRPRYQWLADGLEIPGATTASLTLTNVQPEQAGGYSVHLENGVFESFSRTATLTVELNPAAPILVTLPSDQTVFPTQTAVFSVGARGYPAPRFQWQTNGADIPGATQRTLIIEDVSAGLSGTLCSVRVWNDLGATNASATLTVVPRPRLRITEVMAEPRRGDSSGHYDWFELTNFDTNAVNLQGYRFRDWPTLTGAFTITNTLVIRPGESIVFVEEMSPEQFWDWWGTENRPPGVRVQTFHGFSLGSAGEVLSLWNPAAIDAYDTVATAECAGITNGVSLECTNWWCDSIYGCVASCLNDSVPGERGAFPAAREGDIGSPGLISNPPPRILTIAFDGATVVLGCRVTPGKTYRLEYKTRLPSASWSEVQTLPATDFILRMEDAGRESGTTCFYRLEELP
jgi:hypothetical protein